jgi:hypothetical protein
MNFFKRIMMRRVKHVAAMTQKKCSYRICIRPVKERNCLRKIRVVGKNYITMALKVTVFEYEDWVQPAL